jgi:hypothetical protein
MDWKSIVKSVAPILGTALGGPLAGTAIKVLGETILGDGEATETQVQEALLKGLNPDALVKLKEADQSFATKMKELDIDVAKLQLSEKNMYVSDTQDARKYKDDKVFWLGVVILSTFAIIMYVALFGSYALLSGSMPIKEPSVVGMVSGFVGTIIGYAAANAQQVVGFFFGSSAGSSKKTDAISDAFVNMTEKVK